MNPDKSAKRGRVVNRFRTSTSTEKNGLIIFEGASVIVALALQTLSVLRRVFQTACIRIATNSPRAPKLHRSHFHFPVVLS